MPYIITEKWQGAVHLKPGPNNPTAVATLDEAHATVLSAMNDALERGVAVTSAVFDSGITISESGGTVGPLPDGTVIEVRPMLRDDVTMTAGENRYIAGMTADEMVTAFNAA